MVSVWEIVRFFRNVVIILVDYSSFGCVLSNILRLCMVMSIIKHLHDGLCFDFFKLGHQFRGKLTLEIIYDLQEELSLNFVGHFLLQKHRD